MPALRTIRWALLGAFLVTACDSPIDPTTRLEGVVILRSDGSEAARFIHNGATTGSLRVAAGETAIFRVRVVDDNGNTIPIDGFEFSIRNPGVVLALKAGILIQGPDQIVIEGIAVSSTSIRFQLWRGQQEEFLVEGVRLEVSS